jgi:DNA-binding transcriptional MocR family regulator
MDRDRIGRFGWGEEAQITIEAPMSRAERRARKVAKVVRSFDHSPSTREVAAELGVCFATAQDHLYHAEAHGLISQGRGETRGMGQKIVTVWIPQDPDGDG